MRCFIKKNDTLLLLGLVIFIIVGAVLYYKGILTPQLETFKGLQQENEIKQGELNFLQEEYQVLDQRKKELKEIDSQIKLLEEQIPTYETSITMMSDVIQYTDSFNFENRSVQVGTQLPETDDNKCHTIPFTIEYTTTYENTLKFLEMINRSYHLMRIDSYDINNAAQEKGNPDKVETRLVLHIHYKDDDITKKYPNFMTYLEKESNVFERPSREEEWGLENTEIDQEGSD